MTDSKQNKKGGFSIIAGVTGAIVGAGAAIAGAVVLQDKKNRNKVKKVFTDVKKQAIDYVEKLQKEVNDGKNNLEKEVVKGKKTIQKNIKKEKIEVKKTVAKIKAKAKKKIAKTI